MSLTAFFLILFSSGMHAGWNLLAKKNTMTVPFYTLLCTMGLLCWGHLAFWSPVPVWHMPASFYFGVIGSPLFDAFFYCLAMIYAYRHFEVSVAYPMMRSLPILLTALVSTITGFGTRLTPLTLVGMFIVFVGCCMMPLMKFSDFSLRRYCSKDMLFILLVASGTTGYTIFDKLAIDTAAAQVSGTGISSITVALSCYAMREIVLCSILWTLTLATKSNREILLGFWHQRNFQPLLAGVMATATYAAVLIAMFYVTNVTYVQTFRQIGLIFGVAGGIFFLHERCTATKITGVLFIIAGLILTVIK